jgi:hypothetical protein
VFILFAERETQPGQKEIRDCIDWYLINVHNSKGRKKRALLNARMICPHPQGEGSQSSCPLSIWERARVRGISAIHISIQQRQKEIGKAYLLAVTFINL